MRLLAVGLVSLLLASQSYPPPFPRDGATKLLDNERVIVWDVVWPQGRPTAMHRHSHDLVGVFIAGGTRLVTRVDGTKQTSVTKKGEAVFSPNGVIHTEEGTSDSPTHAILLELKDASPPLQAEGPSDVPPAFPREGTKQLIDNQRVTVWDYTWAPGSSVALHRHVRDAVAIWLENGKIQSNPQAGPSAEIVAEVGTMRYGPRGTVHSERVVEGSPRGIIIELK